MKTDFEILHKLIQDIEEIYSRDVGNTQKVFFIIKEIGKVKIQMRNYHEC